MQIHHYTVGYHFKNILRDRLLKREGCNLEYNARRLALSKNPAVWFTTNPVWEPTAAKTIYAYYPEGVKIVLDTPEAIAEVVGLARITVPESVAPIPDAARELGVSVKTLRKLIAKRSIASIRYEPKGKIYIAPHCCPANGRCILANP